jgi:hypothetical protein
LEVDSLSDKPYGESKLAAQRPKLALGHFRMRKLNAEPVLLVGSKLVLARKNLSKGAFEDVWVAVR